MHSWQVLLEIYNPAQTQAKYGPNSGVIVRSFEILEQIPWFSQAGMNIDSDIPVSRVSSWKKAIDPLKTRDGVNYGPNGHLILPSNLSIAVIESKEYHDMWQEAANDALELNWHHSRQPKFLTESERDFLWEYVYEFISFLLGEIIAPENTGRTYFREMLAWFYAGHFPCGWEGVYPAGTMRVF